ncbi:MAG: hypothetical protein GY754_22955 [bacterium]|nr:hypothetical protein [bacterium]
MLQFLKRFNFLSVLLILVMAVSVLTGCDGSEELKDIDVYVGGRYLLKDTFYSCYWLNGERIKLNDNGSRVNVYGDGNDVHVASTVTISGDVSGKATYWKNGVPTELVSTRSGTSDIIVQNGEVSILGRTLTERPEWYSHWIWKDGVFTEFEGYGYVTAMALSGDDVYLAGRYSFGDRTPCYWINGTRFDLEADDLDTTSITSENFNINDIAVSGDDVYVVGTHYDPEAHEHRAALWKNGVRTDLELEESSHANAVAIDGSNVYVAGKIGSSSCYWKNGEVIILQERYYGDEYGEGYSEAMDITTCNGNVYIVGHDRGTENGVTVFKNNGDNKVELSIPVSGMYVRTGEAHSIYVQPKN